MEIFKKYKSKNKQYKAGKNLLIGIDYAQDGTESRTYIGLTKEQYEEYLKLKSKNTCLHCGKEMTLYCEKCHQELITKNAELQLENDKLQEEVMENDLKVIGAEEYTEASMREIIENYYTANEDCVPKKAIRGKLKELSEDYCRETSKIHYKTIEILRELLGE